jgi:hypothetical protein
MSEVYRPGKRPTTRLVAVKVLREAEGGANADYAVRYERECRTAHEAAASPPVSAYQTGHRTAGRI